MSSTVQVKVNDQPTEVAASATVGSLLTQLGLAGRKGLAVAIGEQVIPRSQWEKRPLAAGESIVLIQATQGG